MMHKMRRGGKIAAYGSHNQQQPQASSSTTRHADVTPTIASMLQELQELVRKTQV